MDRELRHFLPKHSKVLNLAYRWKLSKTHRILDLPLIHFTVHLQYMRKPLHLLPYALAVPNKSGGGLQNYTFTHAIMTHPHVYHVYSRLVFINGCVYYQAINHLICHVRFCIEATMFGGTKMTCVYLSEWESSLANTSLSLLVKDKLWCCIKAEAQDSLMDCHYFIGLFLCFVSRNLYTHTTELRPSADMYSVFWWILEGCTCVCEPANMSGVFLHWSLRLECFWERKPN